MHIHRSRKLSSTNGNACTGAQRLERSTRVERDGIGLAVRVLLPGSEGRFPAVVFVHGLGSGKDSPRNIVVAERLVDAGIGAILFDLSGHGESGRDPRGDTQPAYVDDLVSVFEWAGTQSGIMPERLGVAGSSLGGVVAIGAISAGQVDPAALVLRAPPIDAGDLGAVSIPTLIIIGSEDPLTHSVTRAARTSTCTEVEVVDGAGHLFEEAGTLGRATELTVDWFNAHLLLDEEAHSGRQRRRL
jgi:alpha-beta hydrolase superfamily lysophospholipase